MLSVWDTTGKKIDLSYHHFGKVDDFRERLSELSDGDLLDISNSHLGDSGIQDLLSSISSRIKLHARMNSLTEVGADSLFDAIIAGKIKVDELDLGFNMLSNSRRLEDLIASSNCPTVLRFDRCSLGPSACRALAQGVLHRKIDSPLLSLYLCGNKFGDPGAAALAAAIRIHYEENKYDIFDALDVSYCGITDIGIEAMALAFECLESSAVKRLILSGNDFSDTGVENLAEAILSLPREGFLFEYLDIGNNLKIGDRGATAIAKAFGRGLIKNLSFRNDRVYADGFAAFGKAIHQLEVNKVSPVVRLDLSGNPLGMLRGKQKEKTSITKQASSTAASYMKMLKKGFQDVTSTISSQSAESDDEAEAQLGEEDSDDNDPSHQRCGAKAFANAYITDTSSSTGNSNKLSVTIGLRSCSFDHSGADALASVLIKARDHGTNIDYDVSFNHVLEDEMVSALHGDESHATTLEDMAERYLDALDRLKESQARLSPKRQSPAVESEDAGDEWDVPFSLDSRDSDADYEPDEFDFR